LTYSYRFWTTLCDRNTEAIIIKARMSTNSLAKFLFSSTLPMLLHIEDSRNA